MTALVPVLEGNDGLHVRDGLFQISRLPCHPVGVCARAYPLERELRLVEYALAGGIQLIDNLGVVSHGFVGHIHEQFVQFVQCLVLETVVESFFLKTVEISPVHKHTRMPHLFEGGEVCGSGRICHSRIRLLNKAFRHFIKVSAVRRRFRLGLGLRFRSRVHRFFNRVLRLA